jgi:hypothetical protein
MTEQEIQPITASNPLEGARKLIESVLRTPTTNAEALQAAALLIELHKIEGEQK